MVSVQQSRFLCLFLALVECLLEIAENLISVVEVRDKNRLQIGLIRVADPVVAMINDCLDHPGNLTFLLFFLLICEAFYRLVSEEILFG